MSLVAWYKLNGNALDSSGNGNNGTIVSTVGYVNGGPIGSCGNFTGAGNIDINNLLTYINSTPFSLSVWIKTTGLASGQGFNGILTLTYGLRLGIDGYGNVAFRNYQDYCDSVTTTNLNNNQWHHIAGTYDGQTMKLYIDNKLINTTINAKSKNIYTNAGCIGADVNNTPVYRFNGNIADVRIYNHALTTKEVEGLFSSKILHYDFKQFQEPTVNILNFDTSLNIWPSGDSNANTLVIKQNAHSLKIIGTCNKPGEYAYIYPIYTTTSGNLYTFSMKIVNNHSSIFKIQIDIKNNENNDRLSPVLLFNIAQNETKYISVSSTIPNTTTKITPNICLITDPTTGYVNADVFECQLEAKPYVTNFILGSRAGTAIDISGHNNNGTIIEASSPKWIKDEIINKGCYQFDGVNDYIQIPDIGINTGNCTISFWCYCDEDEVRDIFFGNYSATNSFNIEKTTGGILRIYISNPAKDLYLTEFIMPKNEWIHVIVTISSFGVEVYKNGIKVYSDLTLSLGNIVFGNPFYIGRDSRTGATAFKGKIADFRIYNKVLTIDEINEEYTNKISFDENGKIYCDEIIENYKHFEIYAKQYPSDGNAIPYAGTYVNGVRDHPYSRSWNISVWNPTKNDWADDVYFYGALTIPHPACGRFDCYDATIGPAQQNAFIKTLQNINENYIVIIAAAHAPETFGAGMIEEIKNYGGTTAKLGWAGNRYSYICVGKKNLGEGNAIREELNNLPAASNSDLTWAYTEFELNKKTKLKLNENNTIECSEINKINVSDGLVAYYPLDGDTNDYSGYNNHLTNYGATTVDKFKSKDCYSFNGTNSDINLGSFFTYQTFTISLWVYAGTTQATYADIFDNNHSGNQNFVCQQNADNVNQYVFGVNNAAGNISATGTIILTPKTWTHLTFTFTPNDRLVAYVNGIMHSQGALASGKNILYSSQNLRLGRWGGGGRNWNGKMSDFRIYNRVLTQNEISDLYDTSKTSTTTGLVAHYPLEGNTNDYVGTNNGTNTGATISYANYSTSGDDRCYSFNGVKNYMSSNFALLGDPVFTVSGWFRRTADFIYVGPWGIGNGGVTAETIESYTNVTNKIGVDLWGAGVQYSNIDYPLNEWVHIIWMKTGLLYSSKTMKIYVNGVNIYPLTNADPAPKTMNITSGFGLGRISKSSDSHYTPIDISEFRIYNRVLTNKEIKSLSNINRPKKQLVTHYPLNGDTNDYSGNDNHLTNYGATIVDGINGQKCYSFNGTNNYMNSNAPITNISLNNSTLSLWCYIESNSNQIIFASSNKLCISMYGNYMVFVAGTSAEKIRMCSSNIIQFNNWNHIVVKYINNIPYVYINKKEVDYTLNIEYWTHNKIGIDIGRRVIDGVGSIFFKGKLQDIRIYNSALTDNEINDLYNNFDLDYYDKEYDIYNSTTDKALQFNNEGKIFIKSDKTIIEPDEINNTGGIDEHTILMLHGEYLTDSSLDDRVVSSVGAVQTSTAQKKFGKSSLYFNGSSYLSFTPYVIGTGDYTVDFWFYNTATTGAFRRWISSSIGGWEAGTFCFREQPAEILNSSYLTMTTPVVRNEWTHYAVVRSGSTSYLFINGVLITSGTSTITDFYEPLAYIGGAYTSNTECIAGYIDELRISKIARWASNFIPATQPYSK